MPKIAVFAPMPRASTMIAESANPGAFGSSRHPCLRSLQKPDIPTPNLLRSEGSTDRQVPPRDHYRILRTKLFDVFAGRNDGRAAAIYRDTGVAARRRGASRDGYA